MPSGRIMKGIGGFYYISTEDGTYECKARGIFRKNEQTLLTGDFVEFIVTDRAHKKGNIERVLDRSSELVRPAVANVDQLVAVIAAKSPEPDLLLLDKLLLSAAKIGISALICINKTDLDSEDNRKIVRDAYTSAGYPVLETSFRQEKGLEKLQQHLKDHVSVFAGQSGVGKSTLLNQLMKSMVMKTGSLSDKIDRGKHTTRHAELIPLDAGGFIVDTPGFSSFELSDIDYKELQHFYPEFADHIHSCRFNGCNHVNEPDCAVRSAVVQGEIDEGRYQRYAELYALLKQEDEFRYKKKPERKSRI